MEGIAWYWAPVVLLLAFVPTIALLSLIYIVVRVLAELLGWTPKDLDRKKNNNHTR